jgi:hypothetical protein
MHEKDSQVTQTNAFYVYLYDCCQLSDGTICRKSEKKNFSRFIVVWKTNDEGGGFACILLALLSTASCEF